MQKKINILIIRKKWEYMCACGYKINNAMPHNKTFSDRRLLGKMSFFSKKAVNPCYLTLEALTANS